jgi:crotonobetainyl-CoA:carnitine CoA-transferase CaiB-like acyl-CoA transferase
VNPEDGGAVLRGIRVLDFTWVVAGPVATRVLADHGADVIKIERLDTPDGAARRGGLFGNLNRGKRSVAIDLRARRGIALARALARRCDVVIDNFSPRVLVNWGLDHATLRRRTPRLIAVSLSGFGASGPLADAVSYGPTLHAQTGCTWHMRHPGGAPAGWGFAFSDMASGYCAALAVLAAVRAREVCGVGCAIDLAQLECLAAIIGPLLGDALRGAPIPDALGNRSPERAAAPDGVYRCGDDDSGRERWCAISVFDDVEWRAFTAAIGFPSWSNDRRFATLADRLEHRDELDRLVEVWTRARSPEAVMQTLQAAGVAAGLVADARDLATDPHLAARGYWARCSDGTILDGVLPRLSVTPGAVAAPGPRLGEHTDDVLRELLGMKQSAVDRLRRDAIIR